MRRLDASEARVEALEVWAELAKQQPAPLRSSPAFARITWRLLAPAAVPALIERSKATSL